MDETKETTHTPGTISLRPSGLLATDVRFIARVEPHGPGGTLTEQDRADGERMVVAWNCHDGLLAALKALDAHWTSGNFSRRADLWEQMRAAITNAERKASP